MSEVWKTAERKTGTDSGERDGPSSNDVRCTPSLMGLKSGVTAGNFDGLSLLGTGMGEVWHARLPRRVVSGSEAGIDFDRWYDVATDGRIVAVREFDGDRPELTLVEN